MLIKITKKMESEINRIMETGEKYNIKSINSPEMLYDILLNYTKSLNIIEREKERVYAIGLDTKNKIKYIDVVSVGHLNSSVAHPREIFRMAILASCNAIILAHNHPSGDLKPSVADIQLTKKIVSAGEIIDIKVLDHIIFSYKGFISMKKEGII